MRGPGLVVISVLKMGAAPIIQHLEFKIQNIKTGA